MPSHLLISEDIRATQQVYSIAGQNQFRFRSIADPQTAREWLGLQSFDVLLIDCAYGSKIPSELLTLAWTINPLTAGALFDGSGKRTRDWGARLLGAELFFGAHVYEDINHFLKKISRKARSHSFFHEKVLVVEDLDSPREIICTYVEALGYTHVEGVSSATEALALLYQNRDQYFCVISDYNMPAISGLQLLQEIRNDPILKSLPVLMLTAASTPENLIECIKAGATGFLAKPLKKVILKTELEKAKRIVASNQSPVLCSPDEAHLLEDALYLRDLT